MLFRSPSSPAPSRVAFKPLCHLFLPAPYVLRKLPNFVIFLNGKGIFGNDETIGAPKSSCSLNTFRRHRTALRKRYSLSVGITFISLTLRRNSVWIFSPRRRCFRTPSALEAQTFEVFVENGSRVGRQAAKNVIDA